ncbi:MAG: hypothetical protein JWO03_3771 [Bacteroidetes bacterium]|nr:hypothetical protein [Bacteroidota bacterium]
MKRRTILLLAIFGFIVFHAVRQQQPLAIAHYNSSDWADHPLIDLQIPDEVTSYISPIHIQVPSTSLSMIVPEGYEQRINMKGYRNADTCIDVHEDAGIALSAKREEVDNYIVYVKKDRRADEAIAYLKDFKFNGYNAFVVCVSDTTSTKTVIYMAFGDDRFSVSMTGTLANNTDEAREEVINTMLTACYKNT